MKKQKKQLKFKNHFDKFPPILREMVMEAMAEKEQNSQYGDYRTNPLMAAFVWINNQCFNDGDFWEAVEQDAIHHKIWKL